MFHKSCQIIKSHTFAGDPLEISAIQEVYGCTNERDKPLIVGSVKTNIGRCFSSNFPYQISVFNNFVLESRSH